MKKSLFAVFLAVMLVAALVFVITPDAKAADNLITAQADNEVITISAADTVLDLNGKKNVVVKIDGGVELSVIDTSFILSEDKLDLTGKNAGTLTVDPASSGTIASVALYGDFRYLAVEEGGTYAFHPFNLAISKLGINTISESVCIRVSFIANDVVRAKLSDYGIKGVSSDATAYSAKENYTFGSKNGIQAYFDLNGSFDADKLDTTCSYQAYMVIDGVDVLSNYIAEITPRAVLKTINSSNLTPTATQKAAIETIATNNAHLADLFTSITGASCTHNATIAATCQKASVCKNCDATIGTTVDHKDDNGDNACDWCGFVMVVEDYYTFGPDEMIIAKKGVTYGPHDTQIDGKDVYKLLSNGWSGEIWASTTSHLLNDETIHSLTSIRADLAKKQYQYATVTFQLSAGAKIGLYHTVPKLSDAFVGESAGFVFTAGDTLTQNGRYIEADYGDRFAVYSNGKQVKLGDPINAGQWYTFVCQLNLDTSITLNGASTFLNIGLTNGNNKPVYVSEVRYYTNDSYKEDYTYDIVLPNYDEKDASELVAYKPSTDVYSNQGTIFGRDNVYGAAFQSNWSVEVVAKTTAANSSMPKANSNFADWTAVRNNYKAQGYQYATIDFALSAGATIRAIGCVPPETAGGNVVTTGLTFTAGEKLAWASTCKTDEQKSYFAVYSEGKEVKVGDTINAGQWYTVVIKLLVDGNQYGQGEQGWASVAFNVGNGKMVYFSNVRYYRNDSYKTDYVYETVDPDYDQKDATELFVYKPAGHDYSNQGSIFGRNDVYGAIFSGWNVEAAAKTTAATKLYADAPFSSWKDVRANYAEQGYQYIAVDFALSEGASIRAIGCVPPAEGGTSGSVIATGLNFVANQKPYWASNCTSDEQHSYFTVYSNGKEVSLDEKINAGQWYTVVIKLLVNGNEYKDGESSWASVAFNVGNGKMVYFSGVRYYRNDSFTTDFAG